MIIQTWITKCIHKIKISDKVNKTKSWDEAKFLLQSRILNAMNTLQNKVQNSQGTWRKQGLPFVKSSWWWLWNYNDDTGRYRWLFGSSFLFYLALQCCYCCFVGLSETSSKIRELVICKTWKTIFSSHLFFHIITFTKQYQSMWTYKFSLSYTWLWGDQKYLLVYFANAHMKLHGDIVPLQSYSE